MSQRLAHDASHLNNAEDIRSEHQRLEQRLHELDRHRSLSPEEHYEVQVIKKRKLYLKDRLRHLEAAD